MTRNTPGYTLVEVLIAGALLAVGISAAALMANSMIMQEEANIQIIRGLNLQEQVGRLYQMGLDYDGITNVLPERCTTTFPPPSGFVGLRLSAVVTNISGVGLVEQAECEIMYSVLQGSDGNTHYASNSVTLIRPTIR